MARNSQLKLLRKRKSAYGGMLRNSRKGRIGSRPIATKSTMHLVLRSSRASGKWSFKNFDRNIGETVAKFAIKYGVKIVDLVNVGNHLHIHLKFGNRYVYKAFIRAITASIAMLVTGASRWKPMIVAMRDAGFEGDTFWDYRPYSVIIESFRYLLNVRDYLEINRHEGFGASKAQARFIVKGSEAFWKLSTA